MKEIKADGISVCYAFITGKMCARNVVDNLIYDVAKQLYTNIKIHTLTLCYSLVEYFCKLNSQTNGEHIIMSY